jgi:hypothetical protein
VDVSDGGQRIILLMLQANDIYGIDAMALAVPYCDVVVTEKACHHALESARLGVRMHTALLRNL